MAKRRRPSTLLKSLGFLAPRLYPRMIVLVAGFGIAGVLIFAKCHAAPPTAAPAAAVPMPAIPAGDLGVVWKASLPESMIQVFTPADLKKVKRAGSTEKDPVSGKSSSFHGILLSDLVEQAMDDNKMSVDSRALIDLVILRNAQGTMALIPRSFIVKYPVLLADREGGKPLSALKSVAPWTSHSRARSEGLPLETYFISGVDEVDLANYRQRYGDVFLRERTDPVAMHGEKIFIQGCLGCHDSQPGMAKARNWTGQHPRVNGAPELKQQEFRALRSYLSIFKSENTATAAQ